MLLSSLSSSLSSSSSSSSSCCRRSGSNLLRCSSRWRRLPKIPRHHPDGRRDSSNVSIRHTIYTSSTVNDYNYNDIIRAKNTVGVLRCNFRSSSCIGLPVMHQMAVAPRRQLHQLQLPRWNSSSGSTTTATIIDYTTLPHDSPEVQALIDKHAHKPQTSASLQTLMKTGRGEFLHKMKSMKGLSSSINSSSSSSDSFLDDFDDGYETSSHSSSTSANNNNNNSEATPLVLLQVASFLRRELPIRLAHRINDLSRVPLLREMKSVKQVKELYTTSFLEILNASEHPPPPSYDDDHIHRSKEDEILQRKNQRLKRSEWERDFASILENVYERHSSVLVQMARGAFELRAAIQGGEVVLGGGDDDYDRTSSFATPKSEGEIRAGRDAVEFELMESTHAFLDRFYLSRIGIRVLIGQYLSLRNPPVENYVGIICGRTSPYEIVKRAIDDAAFMCTRKYGDAPEVIITGRLDLTFPYVPTHLHYIMLELLKNSMRATVEYHGIDADYPPIKVVIADGSDNEDVIIKVSDEGGGIPRSNMKRIWSYLFTTADPEIQEGMVAFNENVDHSIDSPLAGLGYGLPISRSYARYFGGDLSIMSMEGYGTDCFVYLTRLGNTREPLPI